jgi:phosphoribosylformimino-5-aminoimidazole carboxamide ribotide isomerase
MRRQLLRIMLVIPVLDLQGGVVVRAAGGDRSAYRPIVTPLSASPQPHAVLHGLMTLAPFRVAYLADLDALSDREVQSAVLAALIRDFPSVSFWVDAGIGTQEDLARLMDAGPLRPVFGSETLVDPELLRTDGAILSLDFKHGAFMGQPALLSQTELWPDDIIVMSLDAVGARRGPDFSRVKDVVARGMGRRVFAAGGVRTNADLATLRAAGAAGALVSTALHSGDVDMRVLCDQA